MAQNRSKADKFIIGLSIFMVFWAGIAVGTGMFGLALVDLFLALCGWCLLD